MLHSPRLPAFCVALFAASSIALAEDAAPATRPAETTTVRVRVTDRDGGAPTPSARVVFHWDGQPDERSIPVNANGEADVLVPSPAPDWIQIHARAPGRMPLLRYIIRRSKAPTTVPSEIAFSMFPGVKWSGLVLDADGKPAEGATVRFTTAIAGLPDGFHCDVWDWDVFTGPDGRWTLDDAPANPTKVQAVAWHLQRGGTGPGFFDASSTIDPSKLSKLLDGSYTQVLEPATLVRGRVTDSGGKPIAGVKVAPGNDRFGSNMLPPTETDADGRYAIAGTRGQPLTITFTRDGYAPELARVAAGATPPESLDVTLPAGKTLAGRVVDDDGKPIAGASVGFDTWRGARTLVKTIKTDADGRFEWRDAPADEIDAAVYHEGHAQSRDVTIAAGRDNVVTLGRPVTFRGTVVDADTKRPITDFKAIEGIKFSANGNASYQREDIGREPPSPADTAAGKFAMTFTYPYPIRVIRVEAPDYAPADSPSFTMKDVDPSFTFELRKTAGIAGTILAPDGKPAAKVTVVLGTERAMVNATNGRVTGNSLGDVPHATTDEAGRFRLPPVTEPYALYASGDAGYATIAESEIKAGRPITLHRFARLSGAAFEGEKPVPNAMLYGTRASGRESPFIAQSLNTTADADGRFDLPSMPAGDWSFSRWVSAADRTMIYVSPARVTLAEGEAATVALGKGGRLVVGRADVPAELRGRDDWVFGGLKLTGKLDAPTSRPTIPENLATMSQAQREAFLASDEGKALLAKIDDYNRALAAATLAQKTYGARVDPDGSYRFVGVEPGTYSLAGELRTRTQERVYAPGERVATIGPIEVIVPASESSDPIAVPETKVAMRTFVATGQPAPDFEAPTLDGKSVKLSSLRGKFVLLDFWATWCGPCVAETPDLKATWDRFGKDDRFAMISLSLDDEEKAPRDYVAKEKLGWTQAFLGTWDTAKAAQAYGVEGIPDILLVGPDGKVIARGLRGPGISEAIAKALGAAK